MPEDASASFDPETLSDVEQSLAKLQDERCACLVQLQALLASGPAAANEISHYLSRIDAINDIMLALARVTTITPSPNDTASDISA